MWSCIVEVAGLPNKACLTLALQILDKLPTLPLDLSYCTAIPRMLAYCPESYAFQAWSTAGDRDYLLDNNTWATSLLSLKLAHMAGRANLDDRSPSGATSPAGEPALPCPALQCAHHPTPTPGLQQREGEGDLDPTPCPASFLRGPSQNPPPPLTLMRAAVAAQHLKMTASLMVRVRQAPMMEVAVVQMMKALAAASLAVKKQQTMRVPSRTARTMKVRGPAVRWTPPVKKAPEVNLNTSQMLSLSDLDNKDLKEEQKTKQRRDAHLLDKDFGKKLTKKESATTPKKSSSSKKEEKCSSSHKHHGKGKSSKDKSRKEKSSKDKSGKKKK